jgi:nuclear transport factor 2 (NTF2) superfamily protein
MGIVVSPSSIGRILAKDLAENGLAVKTIRRKAHALLEHVPEKWKPVFRKGHAQLFRSKEQWEFDEAGFMRRREAGINDVRIAEKDQLFHWPLGPRPADRKGLSELGL